MSFISLFYLCFHIPYVEKENHVATDSKDAKWWLQLANKILFIYKGVCIIGIDKRNSFVSTCDIAQQTNVFISLWPLW